MYPACTGNGKYGLTCGFNSDDQDALDAHVMEYHLAFDEAVWDCKGNTADA